MISPPLQSEFDTLTSNALNLEVDDFHSSTILIIDDNPNNLSVAVDSLSELGATVIIARSGERGLKRANYAEPDLILLDILMPDMDGFEVCRRLKLGAKTRTIPVVFMTALTETEDKVRGLRSGGIDYITKPFQVEELLARMTNHLNMQRLIRQVQANNQELQRLVPIPTPTSPCEFPKSNLQRALDYIQSHLDQKIRLDAIAAEIGMSQFYFCRWFRRSMGIAPYQYVIQQRVERAKTLIKRHELSLVEIAFECGFSNQSHLIHHFKKQIGMTPSQYRQQLFGF